MNPLAVQLIIMSVFGLITATIGSKKGRSGIGWFFVGFFTGLIGLIISLVVSDLGAENSRRAEASRERRRLREQLKQERMKSEAFRRHAQARLDSHDDSLGTDTRQAGLALEGGAAPRQLSGGGTAALAPSRQGVAPPGASPVRERSWMYETNGSQRGPVPESVLLDLIENGTIDSGTLVWTEGIDWTPAGRISRLKSRLST